METELDSRYFPGYIDGVVGGEVRGWVVDPAAHSRLVTVCIKVNRRLVARSCAIHHRPDVASLFGTHGRHGFMYRLPSELRAAKNLHVEVIADNGYPIGNRTFPYERGKTRKDPKWRATDRTGPLKLFLHLPKTGGTSFAALVRRRFSPTERLLIYPDPPGIPRELLSSLTEAQLKQFKCIYGHFFFGLHEDIPVECRYSTVLRNPVARTISHYFHYQRTRMAGPGNVPSWSASKDVAFELHGPAPSEEFDNLMVRMISGEHPEVGKVTQKNLYRAIRNLDRYFDFVGVMEDSATWPQLKSYFGISAPMGRENVGGYNAAPFDSPQWVSHLERLNAYDMELYRYAQKRSSQR